jgi:hypothetical protein
MNHIRWAAASTALLLAAFVTCSNEERAKPLEDGDGLPYPGTLDNSGGRPNAELPDASIAGDAGAPVTNCGDLSCRGAGKCVVEGDVAKCVCDEGYVLVEDECVVDEECIKLRLLEPGCRQALDREPALAMFFNVETCAGTTVRSDVLGPISSAFKVLEDGNDLGEESYATVIDRDVESFIAIAIDLSTSVANDPGLLDSMIGSVIGLIEQLEPQPGEAPVSVELIVFGRSVQIDVPFTPDLPALTTRLNEIRQNTAGVVEDPEGTNLNGAVNLGMGSLDAAFDARLQQTGGAVVSTGTLITITDGKDTAGAALDALDVRFNLISVGVSGEIDDAELTRVGPQGSFLAPEQADREQAFATIAQRVAEYPKRAHLLAYCSPAVAGTHTVVATLANREAEAEATCAFDATNFAVGEGVCNAPFIDDYCSSGEHGCGTFLACGPCTSDGGGGRDAWEFTND